jgi:hypothetical protein
VRRASQGVERFEARQAAFEDVLIAIADRIDTINSPDASNGDDA